MNLRRVLSVGCLALGLSANPLRAGDSVGGGFSLLGRVGTLGGTAAGGAFAVVASVEPATTEPVTGGEFAVSGGLVGVVIAVAGDVTLTVGFTLDGQVRIEWPVEATGHVLEASSSLGERADWQAVTPAPLVNTFTTPANQALRFYRLRRE